MDGDKGRLRQQRWIDGWTSGVDTTIVNVALGWDAGKRCRGTGAETT